MGHVPKVEGPQKYAVLSGVFSKNSCALFKLGVHVKFYPVPFQNHGFFVKNGGPLQ